MKMFHNLERITNTIVGEQEVAQAPKNVSPDPYGAPRGLWPQRVAVLRCGMNNNEKIEKKVVPIKKKGELNSNNQK